MKRLEYALLLFVVYTHKVMTQPTTQENSRDPNGNVLATALETELRNSLLTNYDVKQRPTQDVDVEVSMSLGALLSLDIKTQILSTQGTFRLTWLDKRLAWSSNTTYNSIRYTFTDESSIWLPPVIVQNSATELTVFSNINSLVRLLPFGEAVWSSRGIFQTNCEVDVTYYPMDVQECSIVLTTSAYSDHEMTLMFAPTPIEVDKNSKNGEWDIEETSVRVERRSLFQDSSFNVDSLYFTFKLRRRPLYHILSTIIPVILISSLMIFVFKLPPESGERVGMSLTVLLAYALYLTLIADSFPPTSISASILSIYLTIILILGTLSVIFTIIVLDIYFNHEDDESPPAWLQKFTKYFLVKVTLWKGETCFRKRKVNPNVSITYTQERINIAIEEMQNGNIMQRKVPEKDNEELDKPEEKIYSWKEVALILDRFFMYLFICMVVTSTVICLSFMMSVS